MLLKHFHEPFLAQNSFVVGCPATGEAIVIDPNRHIDQYVDAADAEGLCITAVTETHIHADFVSGAYALARRTGATLHLSAEGGSGWQYAAAGVLRVRALHDGDVIRAGKVRLDVLHTPGHTPEHLTFLLVDESAAAQPLGAFTGDFVFAGDVGRPDLLEKAAGQAGTMESAARQLFASLRDFAAQPDGLLIWPGHGAGSACGKRLGGVPVTSIRYERVANWAFKSGDEASFVREVLADQQDPPPYFAEMKQINRAGAPPMRRIDFRAIGSTDLAAMVTAHAQFLDIRPGAASSGFLPGSITLPLTRQFLAWAGSVVRYGMPAYVVAGNEADARRAVTTLALIGLDDVRGWISDSVLARYLADGGVLERVTGVDVAGALDRQIQGHLMLDVRTTAEWRAGHVPNAMHAPLARLLDAVHDIDRDTPVIVYCQLGARSVVAASALRRVGFTHVLNLTGGFTAYQADAAAV